MAGYLTRDELDRLITDAEYADAGPFTYYGRDPEVTVRVEALPDGGLAFEAKRGRAVVDSGPLTGEAVAKWLGDVADTGWARA